MTAKSPSPDDTLAELTRNASPRKRRSLELIHGLCKDQYSLGSRDFSIATIGRLSSALGGPSAQPIRNRTGEEYRALLAAWANYADGLTRKPPARAEAGVAEDILDMIADASVRAIVGVMLAESRKLKRENTLLKSQAQVVVDRRPAVGMYGSQTQHEIQVLPPMSNLMPLEIDALRESISEKFLQQMGWVVDAKNGRVTKDGRAIFKPGFATAIRKVIEACANA